MEVTKTQSPYQRALDTLILALEEGCQGWQAAIQSLRRIRMMNLPPAVEKQAIEVCQATAPTARDAGLNLARVVAELEQTLKGGVSDGR